MVCFSFKESNKEMYIEKYKGGEQSIKMNSSRASVVFRATRGLPDPPVALFPSIYLGNVKLSLARTITEYCSRSKLIQASKFSI